MKYKIQFFFMKIWLVVVNYFLYLFRDCKIVFEMCLLKDRIYFQIFNYDF